MFDCKVDSSKTWSGISSKAPHGIEGCLFIRIHSGIHRKACHIGHNLHSNGAVKSFAKIDGLVKRMERVCIESSSGLQQIVRIMMRTVLVIVTTTRRVTTKMIIAMKTRATRKTTPTALTHTTPTAPLRPRPTSPDAAPKTIANSATNQPSSASATHLSLGLPMYRRTGILTIIYERSDESLMREAEYQEITLI